MRCTASSAASTRQPNERDLNKEQKKKRKHKNLKYKGVLDLIPAKHRIVTASDNPEIATVLGKCNRITVYETQKRIAARQDLTNDNIKKLLSLSKNSLKSETANNLLTRAVRRRYTPKTEKPKKPQETVFTEEDFKKFEQEYRLE